MIGLVGNMGSCLGPAALLLVFLSFSSTTSASRWPVLGVFTSESSADTDSFQTATLDDDVVDNPEKRGRELLLQHLMPALKANHLVPRAANAADPAMATRPPRDAALLLDKLLYALRRRKGEQGKTREKSEVGDNTQLEKSSESASSGSNSNLVAYNGSEMERRGSNANSKVYWRCYFNAVSCFK